jgi:hypothetical protein
MLKGKELGMTSVLGLIAISLIVPFNAHDVSAVKSNLAPDNTKAGTDNQKTMMRINSGNIPHKECPDKGPIPPDCTKNPFPNSTMALR